MNQKPVTISDLSARAESISRDLATLLRTTQDYDFARLLKKVDADLIDVRHNLQMAAQLTGNIRRQPRMVHMEDSA